MQYRSSNPNTRVGFTLVVIASLAMGPFSNDADACEWVPAGSYPVVQGEVQLWDNDYAGIVGGLLGLFPGGDKSHTSMCLDTSYGRCTKLGEQTAWPTTQEVIDRCFSNSACGLSVCCVNGFGTSEQVQSGGLLYRSPAQSYLGRWGTAFWHLDATRRSQQRNAIYNEVSATNAYNYMTDTWMYQSRYPYRISGYSEHIANSMCSEFIGDVAFTTAQEGLHQTAVPAGTKSICTSYACSFGYCSETNPTRYCIAWSYPVGTVGWLAGKVWSMVYDIGNGMDGPGWFKSLIGDIIFGCDKGQAVYNMANQVTYTFLNRCGADKNYYEGQVHDVSGITGTVNLASFLGSNSSYSTGQRMRVYDGYWQNCGYCGDGICAAQIGETSSSCCADCGGCAPPPPPPPQCPAGTSYCACADLCLTSTRCRSACLQ